MAGALGTHFVNAEYVEWIPAGVLLGLPLTLAFLRRDRASSVCWEQEPVAAATRPRRARHRRQGGAAGTAQSRHGRADRGA